MKIIYDPIHGPIELPELCIQIINTIEFQRLRNIYQLGVCYYVFPGASHKRFEHSIGVCHLAGEFIRNLQKNQPELGIDYMMVENVQIAGLCHDLGHGPFSHLFDNDFLKTFYSDRQTQNLHHEERSCSILRKIISEYQIQLSSERVDIICDLIHPKQKILKQAWIYEIVANCDNGIDVDKFDYLSRDCYNLGVSKSFCHLRLLKYARVIKNHICYPKKMIFEINNLFQTRYMLHNQFYNHQVVKSIEFMITDIFRLVNPYYNLSVCICDLDSFLKLDDNLLSIISFKFSGDTNMISAQQILSDIQTRRLYKFIEEVSIQVGKPIDATFQQICSFIQSKYPNYKIPEFDTYQLIIENLDLSYSFSALKDVYFYDSSSLEIVNIEPQDFQQCIHPIKNKKLRFFYREQQVPDSVVKLISDFKQMYYQSNFF